LDLILPVVQQYAEMHTSAEDPLLEEIHAFTKKEYPEAQMISGHLQGKLLEMISFMIRPRRILEIGSFTGYSALCLAKGLPEEGKLHTIELREKDAAIARNYFDRSALGKKIISHCGNALEIIPKLEETWDLVFIDADKPAYVEYFNLVFPHMPKNGFILADNIFFHGKALEENPTGKSAKGIREFNRFILERRDIDKMVLTIRDGLYLIRKL
jgi:predicted O-methyltransferase YrrM